MWPILNSPLFIFLRYPKFSRDFDILEILLLWSPVILAIFVIVSVSLFSVKQFNISKALFRKLATQGHVFSNEKFRTLKATYYRLALDMVQIYKTDAEMNGLNFDVHKEEEMVELFAQNIIEAGKIFLDSPSENPNIPTWRRVDSADPTILKSFNDAVMEDNT